MDAEDFVGGEAVDGVGGAGGDGGDDAVGAGLGCAGVGGGAAGLHGDGEAVGDRGGEVDAVRDAVAEAGGDRQQ